MVRRAVSAAFCLSLLSVVCIALAEYPKPSPYKVAWELDFNHGIPQRIVVAMSQGSPKAYWYLPYTVVNNTGSEREFLPIFELVTEGGEVIRSDKNIPVRVFDAIKDRERNSFLEHPVSVAGTIRLGEAQARDSVAIWEEPAPEMGRFSIYVGGLSGEYKTIKIGDKDVNLRKSLQLNYLIRGDAFYPGEDDVNENPTAWVMR
jgi:hypothetical protein